MIKIIDGKMVKCRRGPETAKHRAKRKANAARLATMLKKLDHYSDAELEYLAARLGDEIEKLTK
jgi:hypothetical protein